VVVESTTSTISSHRQVCITIFLITNHRCRLYIVAAFGGDMSPSFAVPGECPWRERLRPSPTAALAAPSLYPPQAALGFATEDFESTTSTISSHRQGA